MTTTPTEIGYTVSLGNYRCVVVLWEILQEYKSSDRSFHKPVGRRLQNYKNKLISLQSIDNPAHREHFLRLLRAHTLAEIEETPWPEKLKEYVNTVVVTLYREEIKRLPPLQTVRKAERLAKTIANDPVQAPETPAT